MTYTPKSFEEFYYRTKSENVGIEIVENYARLHNGDFDIFRGEMFCPECRLAKLNFINKRYGARAHLKRIPSSSHKNGCSYKYDYASKKSVKKYIDSLNYEEIQDKLNSIINMFFRSYESIDYDKIKNDHKPEENNPMLIMEKTKKGNVMRSLRRKNLNSWIDRSDGEDFHVFYGKVKLRLKEEPSKFNKGNCKYYFLQIFTLNKNGKWKFRTNLYRGSIKDSIDENIVYYMAILGNLDFKYKPWTIKLANKNSIKYRECK